MLLSTIMVIYCYHYYEYWIMDIILLMALDVATLSLYGMIRVGLRPALGICFWWMICQRP